MSPAVISIRGHLCYSLFLPGFLHNVRLFLAIPLTYSV